jgi:hypothetical protein
VNKNTDALHLEIIQLDTITADQFLDRGRQLVFMPQPPKRINESPGWFGCTFCDHKGVCHLKKDSQINCRTCYHSRPGDDGKWRCHNVGAEERVLTEDMQLAGCAAYLKI